MKIFKLLLATILLITSVSVWSQKRNIEIVKNSYPQVYTSILQEAEKQWGDDSQTKQTIIEGQAQSFLEIIDSPATLNADIMTEAIINNSLPGSRNSNITIINDLSIKNPFPHLKCDWYKVKTYYEKRAGSLNNYASTNSYDEVLPSTITTAVSEQEKEDKTEVFTPVYTAQDKESTRRDTRYENTYSGSYEAERKAQNERYFARQKENKAPRFNIGAKVGVGASTMYGLGSYIYKTEIGVPNNLQVSSPAGLAAEAGLVFRYKVNGFFVQNETAVQYTKASFKNKIYESANRFKEGEKYSNNYLYLQTAFHLGGYYEVGDGINLVGGIGPYIAFKLNADYDKYGIFGTSSTEGKYEQYMKDGEKTINFGVSGIFGADINKYRIALYPSLGLTKVQEKEDYKPLNILLGFTYFFY